LPGSQFIRQRRERFLDSLHCNRSLVGDWLIFSREIKIETRLRKRLSAFVDQEKCACPPSSPVNGYFFNAKIA
jgi:hypothetical protein